MGYLGYKPADKPLTSADITDSIITSAKIVDGTITNADVASSIITGQTAETSIAGGDSVLIYDDSASALRKMTRTNFVSGLGAAAGQVIQVVSATDSTARTTNSTTFVTASNTLSVSITPSSTSNKIFIIATGGIYIDGGTTYAKATIYRDGSTNLGNGVYGMSVAYDGGNDNGCGLSLSYLDSPNTTSSTTYQVYFRSSSSGNTAYLNVDGSKGSITVMEIKG